MELARSVAGEVIKEIGNKSREFYEFVLPPVDMHVQDDKLTVTVDLPGFDKKDIEIRLNAGILSISAKKPEARRVDESVVCNQRPRVIDKKIRLPVNAKGDGDAAGSARLADGVLTVVIPFARSGKNIAIE